MMEPPDQAENPFVQVQIEDNVIELDPGEYGSLVNDITLEVRADSAGRIRVGPIDLGAYLEDRSQKVEVTLKAVDENGRDIDRFPPVKLSWNEDDQEEPRFWSVFTGDETIMPYFKYQVRCIVKGSFFSKGMEWTGPWNDHAGNGAITLSIPYPEDDGVSVRSTTSSDISTPPGSTTAPGNPSTEGSTPTPPPGGDTSTPPPNREQPRSGAEESGIEISSWKVEESAASRGTKGVPPAGPYRDAPTSESDEDGISVLGWKTQ
jgi:hypothetical protein